MRGALNVFVVALAVDVLDMPTLPDSANDPNLQGGYPLSEMLPLDPGERALARLNPVRVPSGASSSTIRTFAIARIFPGGLSPGGTRLVKGL